MEGQGVHLGVGHRGNQRVLGRVMVSHHEAGRTHALGLVSQQVAAPALCVIGYDEAWAPPPSTSQPGIIPPLCRPPPVGLESARLHCIAVWHRYLYWVFGWIGVGPWSRFGP